MGTFRKVVRAIYETTVAGESEADVMLKGKQRLVKKSKNPLYIYLALPLPLRCSVLRAARHLSLLLGTAALANITMKTTYVHSALPFGAPQCWHICL